MPPLLQMPQSPQMMPPQGLTPWCPQMMLLKKPAPQRPPAGPPKSPMPVPQCPSHSLPASSPHCLPLQTTPAALPWSCVLLTLLAAPPWGPALWTPLAAPPQAPQAPLPHSILHSAGGERPPPISPAAPWLPNLWLRMGMWVLLHITVPWGWLDPQALPHQSSAPPRLRQWGQSL